MAEEKFAGRPQILKGDIVRFIAGETGKEVVEVVTCEIEEGASYTPAFSFNPFFNKVLAVYRFDGRDFKCIWESAEYQFQRWNEACKLTIKLTMRSIEDWKDVLAALENLAKAARDKARKAIE